MVIRRVHFQMNKQHVERQQNRYDNKNILYNKDDRIPDYKINHNFIQKAMKSLIGVYYDEVQSISM